MFLHTKELHLVILTPDMECTLCPSSPELSTHLITSWGAARHAHSHSKLKSTTVARGRNRSIGKNIHLFFMRLCGGYTGVQSWLLPFRDPHSPHVSATKWPEKQSQLRVWVSVSPCPGIGSWHRRDMTSDGLGTRQRKSSHVFS